MDVVTDLTPEEAHAFQGGLADELGDEGVARLVGNVALGVERRR